MRFPRSINHLVHIPLTGQTVRIGRETVGGVGFASRCLRTPRRETLWIPSPRYHSTSPIVDDNLKLAQSYVEGGQIDDAAQMIRSCSVENGNADDTMLVNLLKQLDHSPHLAEKLLRSLQTGSGRDDSGVPRRHHFRQVLQAWNEAQPAQAKRAQALLDYMDHVGLGYDTDSCNLVLQAWASTRIAEGGQAFLEKMCHQGVKLNVTSFEFVLRAWSTSRSSLASKRADWLFSEMKQRGIRPSVECFRYAIGCHLKRKKSEKYVEALYREMKKACVGSAKTNADAFQEAMLLVLQAYRQSSNAHRSEELLIEFAEEYRKNRQVRPTTQMCRTVLSTWSRSKSKRKASRAEKFLSLMEKDKALPNPDVASYTAVLNCWAASNKPHAAQRAELLLRLMEANGDTEPNVLSYTCVLTALARSSESEAPQHAERLLAEMISKGLEPDRVVYTAMINVWGRSKHTEAITRAEHYLQSLKDAQLTRDDDSCRVTVVPYTALIQAWANHVSRNLEDSRPAVDRVEELHEEMLRSNDPSTKPNSLTYAALLKTVGAAWRIPDRRDRANAIVQHMESQGAEVTPYIFGLVKTCSSRSPKRKGKK